MTYRDLAPRDAATQLHALRIIDVREPDEYTGPLGHIAGAELVPLSTVLAEAERWDRDAPLLVICRSGGRSSRAAAALVARGFRSVFNLTGGMLAWKHSGLPSTTLVEGERGAASAGR